MKQIKKTHLLLLLINLVILAAVSFWPQNSFVFNELFFQYIFILIPVLIYAWGNKIDLIKGIGLKGISFKDGMLLVFLTLIMQPALSFLGMLGYFFAGAEINRLLVQSIQGPFWLTVFSMAVTPAICEEFLFRGLVQNAYENISYKKAALMNGLLFGMFHMNFYQFSYTFFMGIVLFLVVYSTKSILAGMIVHFLNNFISLWGSGQETSFLTSRELLQQILSLSFMEVSIYLFLVGLSFWGVWRILKSFLVVEITEDRGKILPSKKITDWPLVVYTMLFLLQSISFLLKSSGG